MSPPPDRLAQLGDAMTAALEQHPDRGDERCMILFDAPDGGGLHVYGYEDDSDAAEQLLSHVRALYWARGLALLVIRPGELDELV